MMNNIQRKTYLKILESVWYDFFLYLNVIQPSDICMVIIKKFLDNFETILLVDIAVIIFAYMFYNCLRNVSKYFPIFGPTR